MLLLRRITIFLLLSWLVASLAACGSSAASQTEGDHSHDSDSHGEGEPTTDVTIEVTNVWARPAKAMEMEEMEIEENGEDSEEQQEGADEHAHDEHGASAMNHGGTTSAVYLMLNNIGNQDDILRHIHANDVAQAVELHHTTIENDVMKMQPVENGLPLPSGEQIELKPGSYHIMLINLKRDLEVGDHFELQLHFENAGEMSVQAEVREQ